MAANVELKVQPAVLISSNPKEDAYTHRPRTPNYPYSELTETQIKNIKQKSEPFFQSATSDCSNNRDLSNTRFFKERYVNSTSQHLLRDPNLSSPYCWIDEQKLREPNCQHDASKPGAYFSWGPDKVGDKTLKHFEGEDKNMYLLVDTYHRPPTNQAGIIGMKYGRPNGDYYSQRNPQSGTWFNSSHRLNESRILQGIEPKTSAEYGAIDKEQQSEAAARIGAFPELSEYQDGYQLKRKTSSFL